jgi:hypothetical protein
MKNWNAQRTAQTEPLADGSRYASGKTVEAVDFYFLEAVLRSERPRLQADVLAVALANSIRLLRWRLVRSRTSSPSSVWITLG